MPLAYGGLRRRGSQSHSNAASPPTCRLLLLVARSSKTKREAAIITGPPAALPLPARGMELEWQAGSDATVTPSRVGRSLVTARDHLIRGIMGAVGGTTAGALPLVVSWCACGLVRRCTGRQIIAFACERRTGREGLRGSIHGDWH
jgi:hypothetical protein